MKRILALILAILMILCTFAACDAFAEPDSKDDKEQAEKETEKEFEKESNSEEEKAEPCSHSDENKDHSCDKCKTELGEHKDAEKDGNHACDYCGATLTTCNDSDSDHVCDECGAILTQHNYQNGTCTICKTVLYVRNESKITFGSYPQAKVSDDTLIVTLNTKAGTLPTNENAQSWTSYGYYKDNSTEKHFMWYIDVTEDGERYRGVYFTSYRPYRFDCSSRTDYTSQDDNGYTASTVYWFKYEPISWTILSENTTDGTALILCDMIIDSQAYQDIYGYDSNTGKYYNISTGVPSGTYANNYAYSTIRKWLNETFYNTVFNDFQKQLIVTTTVDNSVESTGYTENQYVCANTEDKIFLLSYQDVINSNYGFSSSSSAYDEARQKQTTDYAQAQGYAGKSPWWLRSPSGYSYYCVRVADYNGNADCDYSYIYHTHFGVVPALQIRL